MSSEKSRRCDDNQQITVSHFGEHKRLHLESSKQNYSIISVRTIIKAIFTSLRMQFRALSTNTQGKQPEGERKGEEEPHERFGS